MQQPVLGAILAGGASRRFGAPKAFASVGGIPLVRRVLRALREATPDVALMSGDAAAFAELGLPVHADEVPALGALGGIRTALQRAEAGGRPGALCVACDMPFLSGALLRHLAERAGDGADAVIPESTGRRGVEPLCAFYSVRALPAVVAMLAAGERRAAELVTRLHAERVPLDEVRGFGDPDTLFLNVNTPEDHRRALEIARAAGEESDVPA